MKRKVFVSTVTSIVMLIACSSFFDEAIVSKKKGLYLVDSDNIEINPTNCFYFSTLFKGIPKTIFLETSESCLIGLISKIRVCDQFFLVLDGYKAKSLFVFDKEGRFIRKIGRTGQGPGEYVQPCDFTIDKENRTVYVLDRPLRRIQKYEIETGKFIHSIRLDQKIGSNNIEYSNGKLYADADFPTHSNNNYLLRVIHEPSGKEENKFLNVVTYNKGISNTNFLQSNVFFPLENGNIVFMQQFMDYIFEISKDSIFSLIDFKGKEIMTAEEVNDAMAKDPVFYMPHLFGKRKFAHKHSFIEHRNKLFFYYQKGQERFPVLIDKRSKDVSIFATLWNDLLYIKKIPVDIQQVGCYDADGVYFFIEQGTMPLLLKEAKAGGLLSPDLDKLEELKKLEEDANPVIFYYEFKD